MLLLLRAQTALAPIIDRRPLHPPAPVHDRSLTMSQDHPPGVTGRMLTVGVDAAQQVLVEAHLIEAVKALLPLGEELGVARAQAVRWLGLARAFRAGSGGRGSANGGANGRPPRGCTGWSSSGGGGAAIAASALCSRASRGGKLRSFPRPRPSPVPPGIARKVYSLLLHLVVVGLVIVGSLGRHGCGFF